MILFLLFSIFALAAHWFAAKKGFFQWNKGSTPHVSGINVLLIFGTYLLVTVIVVPFLSKILVVFIKARAPDLKSVSVLTAGIVQAGILVALFILLTTLLQKQNPKAFLRIWKDKMRPQAASIGHDFTLGVLTWILSFPVVMVVGEIFEQLLKALFHLKDYEQTAVKFVKMATSSPLALLLALFAVIIMAPLIEEFLFRGTLQTYLKRHLGPRSSIMLTALTFALFHFATSQGLGNLSLILSLFILGIYLGFLYERQGSLFAPIGLHMTFNTISALRIIFFSEA
jgi:hypothetical protein